ncbi:hypothetical protein BHO_0900016 [Borrelia hermsii YBT]|nr:hypothetical protein BHO_0900016 [Borrelia hermsii YBT]
MTQSLYQSLHLIAIITSQNHELLFNLFSANKTNKIAKSIIESFKMGDIA